MFDANDNGRPVSRPLPSVLSAMLRASDSILDVLPIATFVSDAGGTILQYNKRAVEIWGRAPQPGQTHAEFNRHTRLFTLDGQAVGLSLLKHVLTTGEPVRQAERMIVQDGREPVVVSVSIDPLRNARGELVGAVNCFIDITERKRTEAALEESRRRAAEQEQRLAATYEHVAIGICEIDPDGRFLRVNEAACAITGYTREELLANRLFRHTYPDDVDADRECFRRQIAGEMEFYSVEKRYVHKGGNVIWLSIRSSPVRSADGRLLYVVRVLQDITERKAAERRQKLLIDELNHRVKNTLATVQSLASQTARGAPTPQEFRERFEGRLIALSKAHDQLTRHHWESADLRELLSASLAPYAATGPDRVVLRGEDVLLRPRAVLTLAMAVHELTTNAAKYGALSAPGGRLEVTWRPHQDESGAAVLRIVWVETGGPPVAAPEQRGFGSQLIANGIASDLHGTVALDFAPEGLRCEIAVPLEAAVVRMVTEAEPD